MLRMVALHYYMSALADKFPVILLLTTKQIAATYGRADMCQWLLELGVDAGTTASSRATTEDGARLMLFDAGA